MIGRDDKNGPQGSGVNEDVCFSLTGALTVGLEHLTPEYHFFLRGILRPQPVTPPVREPLQPSAFRRGQQERAAGQRGE